MRPARYILCLIIMAQIAGAHAQNATPVAPVPVEPFAEDQTEIPDCVDPLDVLALACRRGNTPRQEGVPRSHRQFVWDSAAHDETCGCNDQLAKLR